MLVFEVYVRMFCDLDLPLLFFSYCCFRIVDRETGSLSIPLLPFLMCFVAKPFHVVLAFGFMNSLVIDEMNSARCSFFFFKSISTLCSQHI